MSARPARRSPWAVLAYTVADDRADGDSLDASARKELRSICDAADFFGDVSVAAQVDFKRSRGVFRGVLSKEPRKTRGSDGFAAISPESHPLWRGIQARLDHTKLRVLVEGKDSNAARANVLKKFLRFGRLECPAERYVVFFYGHGYGPLGLFFDADAGGGAADTMALGSLAESVEVVGNRAAVMVFRACNVNTLETAYQLKDAAEFMIASQSIVPIAGIWPWGSFLSALLPDARSKDVAESITRQLALFLDTPANRTPFLDVPYTLIDLGAAHAIAEPLKALADELDAARHDPKRATENSRALESARVGFPGDPGNPGDPALLDVSTMCDNLEKVKDARVAGPARALGELVESRLVKWHYSQRGHHRGLALFYKPVKPEHIKGSHVFDPDVATADARRYKQLALSKATGWDRIALNPLG